MRRLCLLLALVLAPLPSMAQQRASGLIGSWQGRVADTVRGTALVQLVIGNDGSYQRLFGPEDYPGGIREVGVWSLQAGLLRLRWYRYDAARAQSRAAPQEGTSILVVEFQGPNAFRFRDQSCRAESCWGTMRRMD